MKIIQYLSIFGGLLIAATASARKYGDLAPKPERVREIASWLPSEPGAPGAPIADRKAWDRLAALPDAKRAIRDAERVLKTPVPDVPDEWYLEFTKTGNRTHYQQPYGRRLSAFGQLVLGECLENKGRFLPGIEKYANAICAERSWTMPAHDRDLDNFNGKRLSIDLGSSRRAWILAIGASWLGDRLSPAVRETMRREICRRVLDVYLAALRANDDRGNWWMRGDNNWNSVCHAGVVGAALAIVPEREKRAEFIASMESDNPRFISGFTEDGYCSEGIGYWNYGFGHEVEMGLAVRKATGSRIDILEGGKLRKIASYAQGFQLQPGHSPFFADGGGAPSPQVWALMRQIWPDLVPNRASAVPLFSGDIDVIALRAFGQEAAPSSDTAAEILPMRTWFPDAQVLISRPDPESGASGKPFSIAIKGGHNAEQHNHNDLGSYVVMLDGLEMMGDPGGETYTARTFSGKRYESKVLNSWGHPVPVVAGALQPAGRKYAARVVATSFTPERDAITLDLSAAYPVKTLKSLTRTMVYDRKARTVAITDKVELTEPGAFSVPIITYREVKKGDKPGTFWLLGPKGQKVQVDITVSGSPWKLEEESIDNPGKPSPARLAVTLSAPASSASISFLVTAQ